jgi:hypothetical protein
MMAYRLDRATKKRKPCPPADQPSSRVKSANSARVDDSIFPASSAGLEGTFADSQVRSSRCYGVQRSQTISPAARCAVFVSNQEVCAETTHRKQKPHLSQVMVTDTSTRKKQPTRLKKVEWYQRAGRSGAQCQFPSTVNHHDLVLYAGACRLGNGPPVSHDDYRPAREGRRLAPFYSRMRVHRLTKLGTGILFAELAGANSSGDSARFTLYPSALKEGVLPWPIAWCGSCYSRAWSAASCSWFPG